MNPQPYAVWIITLREIDTRAVPLFVEVYVNYAGEEV